MSYCYNCSGTGKIPCEACGEKGFIYYSEDNTPLCQVCHGSGKIDCPECEGTGEIDDE